MMKLSRRALATVVFTLLALTASLTVVAAPATAGYPHYPICNRHMAHRGEAIACVIHGWPKHQHGTVTVRARFWVHKKHHEHRVLSDPRTKVLDRFVTSRHGGRLVTFHIPDHIRKGNHRLTFTVGHVDRSFYIQVV